MIKPKKLPWQEPDSIIVSYCENYTIEEVKGGYIAALNGHGLHYMPVPTIEQAQGFCQEHNDKYILSKVEDI